VKLFSLSLPDNVELTEHPVRLLPGEGTSFAGCNMDGACSQTITSSNSEVNEAYSHVCPPCPSLNGRIISKILYYWSRHETARDLRFSHCWL